MDLFTELKKTCLCGPQNSKHIKKICYGSYIYLRTTPVWTLLFRNLRNVEKQISLMDENHVISLDRQITNDKRYIAYVGKRHTLVDYGKYRSFYMIVLCSLKTDTFLILECEPCRILDRFRHIMYNNMKILVFRELYQYYYMEDIDYTPVM